MSKTWLISDCHLGHKNIISYCNRPFKDVEEMNQKIINNINNIVKEDDILYNLGDFCVGDKERIKSYLSRIVCKKHRIILGNHDKYRPTDYMELGFELAYRTPIILENFFILSHEPLFLNGNCQPYFNICGHEHNSSPLFDNNFRKINISIENISYTPISFNEIKKIISNNEYVHTK